MKTFLKILTILIPFEMLMNLLAFMFYADSGYDGNYLSHLFTGHAVIIVFALIAVAVLWGNEIFKYIDRKF